MSVCQHCKCLKKWRLGLDTVNADELADLKQVIVSMRDGNTKRDDHFDVPKNKSSAAVESLTEDLKAEKTKIK